LISVLCSLALVQDYHLMERIVKDAYRCVGAAWISMLCLPLTASSKIPWWANRMARASLVCSGGSAGLEVGVPPPTAWLGALVVWMHGNCIDASVAARVCLCTVKSAQAPSALPTPNHGLPTPNHGLPEASWSSCYLCAHRYGWPTKALHHKLGIRRATCCARYYALTQIKRRPKLLAASAQPRPRHMTMRHITPCAC